MKSSVFRSVSLLLPAVALFAAPAVYAANTCKMPDIAAAKEAAQSASKPLLILWHGSDWLYDDAAVCAAFQKLESEGKLPVVFGQFDDVNGNPNEVREKALPCGAQFSLPVAVLLAPDGTMVAKYPAETVRSAAKLSEGVNGSLKILPGFMEQVKKAREAKGIPAAAAAKQALLMLPEEEAVRHKELKEIINREDPKDETGGRVCFCMEHGDMYREINKILSGGEKGTLKGAERRFAEAVTYVTDIQKRVKDMPKGKRQQWLAGLGYIYKEQWMSCKDENARVKAAECYRKCAKIDPKSEYGKGAKKYENYVSPNAYITLKKGYYSESDQTLHFERDWHVDVTKSVKGAGTYSFRLVPRHNGGMVTRNYRLVVNGKQVGTANGIDDQKNTKEVEFTVPSVPSGAKVEVWLTAQCNDGWFGCSGDFEMKKK